MKRSLAAAVLFLALGLLATGCGAPATETREQAPPASAPEQAAAPVVDAAPDFTLTGVDGKSYSLSAFKGKVVVLEWTNHGCPYVKKHYGPGNMQRVQREAVAKGAVWLSICSSAPGKQGHMDAAAWTKTNTEMGVAATAVLIDEDGSVGRLYGAKVTPHMFVIGADGGIAYRGAIDDRPTPSPKDIEGAKNHVLDAVENLVKGQPVAIPETRAYG
jgi:peroxiredoxin